MIETTILDYLEEKTGIPSYVEVPDNEPEKYIILDFQETGVEDFLYSGSAIIQCYGNTLNDAFDVNTEVKKAMSELIVIDQVTSCNLDSAYNSTDVTKKRYRYQRVYDLTYYD